MRRSIASEAAGESPRPHRPSLWCAHTAHQQKKRRPFPSMRSALTQVEPAGREPVARRMVRVAVVRTSAPALRLGPRTFSHPRQLRDVGARASDGRAVVHQFESKGQARAASSIFCQRRMVCRPTHTETDMRITSRMMSPTMLSGSGWIIIHTVI